MAADNRKKILFLCTGNSCRSQMAEGWTRHIHDDRIQTWSAGIEKHGLNPMAVKAMKNMGVDISSHYSKLVDELPDISFDLVVTVCGHADKNCPLFPNATRIIHHGFPDPPELAKKYDTEKEKLACYLAVCREIKDYVEEL